MSPQLFARSTLNSLSVHIAVVDWSGTIIPVNKAWREFAQAKGATENVSEVANYLQAYESTTGSESQEAVAFVERIRSVLSGEQEELTLEYSCHSPTEQRWYIPQVTRSIIASCLEATNAHKNTTSLASRIVTNAIVQRSYQL